MSRRYGSRVSDERVWRLADRELRFGPPLGVGIVNVTDDSFHAGARSGTADQAVADGLELVAAGFDPGRRVGAWFTGRIEALLAAGVGLGQIVLDPGLDFDLTVDDDLELLRRLEELRVADRPLFVALSRKDFLGAVLAGSWEERAPAAEREWATAAATALAVDAGADLVRLHDRSALDALRVAAAIKHADAVAVG